MGVGQGGQRGFFQDSRGVGLRQGAGGVPGSVAQRSDGGGSERELLRTVMRLAGAGHRDVFEYGWSAFVEALEAEAQRRDERMKDAALALRVALHTDGRQFKAFLEA